jgi:hypothetical protein
LETGFLVAGSLQEEWIMSAPGIQLNSEPHITVVQPTIQQYLQGVREAVMSNNLAAAQQAFAQLQKAIPSPAQESGGRSNAFAARISQGVQAVGNALEAGDLPGAEQAVAELRQSFQSASDRQASQQRVAAESVSSSAPANSSEDDSGSDSRPKLSVTV